MRVRALPRLIAFAAALVVAVASVLFAARMAPLPATDPVVAAWIESGGSASDLCGDFVPVHDHSCPYCRLLDDPGVPSLTPKAERLARAPAWQRLADLVACPQQGNPNVSARAPPDLA